MKKSIKSTVNISWFCFRALPGVVLAGLLILLISASPTRASLSSEQYSEEVNSGQLLLHNTRSSHYTPALMLASKVHFDINGMIATVRLEQSFRNDSADWVEAVYAFPLPDLAAVRHMELRIGERRIVGQVREKAIAKAIYNEAKAKGKKASLVEQQRPNMFTNRVANIGPGEQIVVQLEYVQQVEYLAGDFSLRFPMTITPRYMPGAPLLDAGDEPYVEMAVNPYLGWAVATTDVPDAGAISPLQLPAQQLGESVHNPIEITAQLNMGMPLARVESAYHDIALARAADSYSIDLVRGVSEMDRDFVLTWQPVTGSEPQAALFSENVGGDYYGLLMVIPPTMAQSSRERLNREVIFVIDTSGSMGGVPIEQARQSLSSALSQLQPEDYFNIIEFNASHWMLHPKAVPASRHFIGQAQEFVRQLQAGGGTEMLPALQAALTRRSTGTNEQDARRVRQVVFITDGAVGNEKQLYQEITQGLGDSRLFTVGIGSAPNSWFMRKAAQFGRGAHIHIGSIDEVAVGMGELFDRIASPLAIDLQIEWPDAVVTPALEMWPSHIPDLYKGEPLLLAVKFGNTPLAGDVRISGTTASRPWSRRLHQAPSKTKEVVNHQGVASIWARQKIAGLLDQKAMGVSEDDIRPAVLEVALAHQLLSPYTSFVAVEEIVSRKGDIALSSKSAPNARPQGQSAQGFAYPMGATTGPAKAFLGMFFLFFAMMFHIMRRPEADHVVTYQK